MNLSAEICYCLSVLAWHNCIMVRPLKPLSFNPSLSLLVGGGCSFRVVFQFATRSDEVSFHSFLPLFSAHDNTTMDGPLSLYPQTLYDRLCLVVTSK